MTRLLTKSTTFNQIKTLLQKKSHKKSHKNRIDAHLKATQLSLYYGLTPLSPELFQLYHQLTDELTISDSLSQILSGKNWNLTENRAVQHHQCRHPNPPQWIQEEQDKWAHFEKNDIATFTDVVQIGIGGSSLGPKALIQALHHQYPQKVTPHFITSIDPIATTQLLQSLNLEKTLFIVVSKSGSTTETTAIWKQISNYWHSHTTGTLKNHSICITCKNSPLDTNQSFFKRFYMNEAVGGRFSITSAVGGVLTSIVYGSNCFNEVLKGAHILDQTITNTIENNISLFSACLNITYQNIYQYHSRAIIPYSDALSLLPFHLQQLICESNGKQVSRNGTPLPYKTCPNIITGIGTESQHAIFQQFHQGTDIIPIEFIGINGQTELNNHLTAQAVALHEGHHNENPHHHYPGQRPSSILMLKDLSACSIGALIAYYENIVLFEGLLWGINSFDQPGVELGKKLLNETSNKWINTLRQEINHSSN